MQVNHLNILERASQTLAPASGVDLVNLDYLLAELDLYAPLTHLHTSAQITDFAAAVLAVAPSGTGAMPLLANGGLKTVGGSLAVDSGVVSFCGHAHRSVDIVDLPSGVQTFLRDNVTSSPTVSVSGTGPFAWNVVPAPGGGLKVTGAGVAADVGAGGDQVAAGDHTHPQLHEPVTLGASSSLSGTVSDQTVSFELIAAPGGGLVVTPSGVQVDFSVVQRAGGSASETGLTVANTATVRLGYAAGILSGTLPLDANPPGGTGGQIIAGSNGLRVVLGSTGTTAAPGNHGHTAATTLADGFLSASDKARLDTLWSAGPAAGIETLTTDTLTLNLADDYLSGTVNYNAAPESGTGQGALGADAGGLHVVLGGNGNQAAPGNHLHDSRYVQLAGGTLAGTLVLSGTLTLQGASTAAPVNPGSVAGWFAASVNGVAYKIPLYQ